jgi:sugar transferase (PEP-CTERM system associated)
MLKIFQHHIPMWSLLELIADGVLCFLGALIAAEHLPDAVLGTGQAGLPFDTLRWAAAFAGLMALLYSFAGIYRSGAVRMSTISMVGRALAALSIGSATAYLTLQAVGNHEYALLLLVYGVPMMMIGALGVRSVGYVARRMSVGVRRVLIVGSGHEARNVAEMLATESASRHTVVGFYPTGSERSETLAGTLFPTGRSIDELVRQHHVDEVIVAVREQRGGNVPMDQLLACRIRGVPVIDLAGFYERARGEVPTDSLKGSWLVYGHGFAQGGIRTGIKRLFDITTSLALLAISLPVMIVTAIAIKLESPGPLIYRQERVGRGGRIFMCLKFRSMRADAEKDGVAVWAQKNDARITRVGAFIRKCRIDELPQLVSVLTGEMSIVGPRPERPSFVDQLKTEIPFYDIRHSVKPGVTGWAQVRYTYGASVEDARRKHQLDLYYVKNHSLFLDLLILVETVSVVLFREGAH